MKIQKKPDYLIFADSAKKGENAEFPDISRGWGITIEQTASKPPMEWMNGAFTRIDKNILYLLQQGVPEWSEEVTYPVNAIIKCNGVLYTAIEENNNAIPTTNTNKWKKSQAEIPIASTIQKGVVQLSSKIDSELETVAATSLAVKKVNDNANNAHNRINDIHDKFEPCANESRIYSHDKRFYVIVRDDGWVAMYNTLSKRLVWGFNDIGTLCEGNVPVERIPNLDQFVRDRSVPVGVPMPWPQVTPPPGYFECNGAPIDKNRFPKLAAAYPSGFLPDLRGEFIRGWDNGRGADPGRSILSWQEDAIRNIVASTKFNEMIFGVEANGANYISWSTAVPSTHHNPGSGYSQWVTFDASRVVPVSHDNHPRNVAFMYIVKAE